MVSKFLTLAASLALSFGALAQDAVTTVQPPGAPSPTPDYSQPDFSPAPIPTPTAPPSDIAPVETPMATPTPPPDNSNSFAPTWETQKEARTYILQIPAPRGQITDRNGHPLAQTRIGYNLALDFPPSPPMTDTETLAFTEEQLNLAESLLGREVTVPDDTVLKHYHNRGLLPLVIATDLLPAEIAAFRQQSPGHLSLQPVYVRFYPNGSMAGQILGYLGRSGRPTDGPVVDNEELWPVPEGREGLEQTFNTQLTGKNGQLNLAFDGSGQKASEKIVIPPQPGANVITTLDEDIQRLTEDALDKGAKRGAIVIVDATNGDIVAMASKPCFNPNEFVPAISPEAYKALNSDPSLPLLPRAYRSAYPPGSTFKVPVGIAALESGAIKLTDLFSGPPSIQIGGLTFHNWKKNDAGMLDFVDALTQSCDTWFYQVGIKTGADPIIAWAERMGFGVRTGIPLASEADGRVPTEDYMLRVYGRKFLDGDMANFSIGQGDLLVTPLQMAEAMAAIGNGGTLYRARLVQQVQTYNSQIITAYNVEAKEDLGIDPKILAAVKQGMINVVESPSGTAGRAAIDEVQIAGKTGTAQWGSKSKERDAAWFVGFCPADKPQYAFAALYEGEIGESTHGGTYAAPMIADIMKQVFKKPPAKKAEPTHHHPHPEQKEVND
ncbi:MAG: penicillin-binding protein 2 [Chthoniobacteraceae bacterium]|jgi:penicillin-binding protein 2